jgi:serine/threonine-protein kinase RsbW
LPRPKLLRFGHVDRGTRELRPLNFLRDERHGEALMTSTEEPLRLKLDALPVSIEVARAAVSGLAHDLGMEEPGLGDVKTVVSEACTNVVRHAYPNGPGRFEVEASRAGNSLSIVIRDFGVGMRPRIRGAGSSLGLGLGLISMLASRCEITAGSGGTEVRAELPLPVH